MITSIEGHLLREVEVNHAESLLLTRFPLLGIRHFLLFSGLSRGKTALDLSV